MTTATDEHVRALPKIELHSHVEGAATPATLARIARRNGIDIGVDDPAELYEYDDLGDFLRTYDLVCRILQRAEDLHEVTYEALGIAAAAGVRRAEMFFSPTFLLRHGVAFAEIWTGIERGIADARHDHGIDTFMILDVDKPSGPAAAEELLDLALTCGDRLIGLGGDAGERDIDLRGFAAPFARARGNGLRTTMHLGEEGPVSDIRIGVEIVGVERIDHGVCLLDDPDLVDLVAARRVPVTACPSSNVGIGRISSIDEHPLIDMQRAGVLVTVNADNAAMFGIDLADEYRRVRDAFELSLDDLEDLSLAAVDACWAADQDRESLRRRFEMDCDDLRVARGLPMRFAR